MPANHYRFQEEWFVPAEAAEVYAVLADPGLLCEWWQGVYLELTPLDGATGARVGNRYQVVARGFLPYRIRMILETAVLDRPRQVSVRMEGDLCGTWTATLHPVALGTRVEIVQECLAGKPLLRWFSPLLRPLFAWNHRWTTPRGEQGLTRYLERSAGGD